MPTRFLTLICLFLVYLTASIGAAPAPADRYVVLELPPGIQPIPVEFRFELQHLQRIDDLDETVEFSGILTLRWKDERQAFPAAPGAARHRYFHGDYQFNELSPAWYPQIVIPNAVGAPEIDGILLKVDPDGQSTLTQMVHAVARVDLQLLRYPFDQQQLTVRFAILGFDSQEVRLVPASTPVTISEHSVHAPQWFLDSVAISADDDSPTIFEASTLSLSLNVTRESFFIMRLVVFPLTLIVLLSWSVFWMDRSSLGDRMSVSFVGILTAVAYQIMISDIMPHVADFSFLNAFVIVSMLTMAATVVVNLAVGAYDNQNKSDVGELIDRASRVIFPLAFILLVGLFYLLTALAPQE